MSPRRNRTRHWITPVGVALTVAVLAGVLVNAVDNVREAADRAN